MRTGGMREIVESGDSSMMAKFGEISLEYGADIPDAVACPERAVRAGEPGAMRALGHALVNGVGVAKDPARAVALFPGAADAGDLAARESGREADGEVLVRMLESRGRA